MEYELFINRVKGLNIKFQSLEEECDTLWAKQSIVEDEKSKYKSMCQSAEDYDRVKATIFLYIRRLASDLMQTRLDNMAYSKRKNCEITKLKEMLQMANIDYFLTIRDGTKARDKLISLCQKLESSKDKLFITKSVVPERNVIMPNLLNNPHRKRETVFAIV